MRARELVTGVKKPPAVSGVNSPICGSNRRNAKTPPDVIVFIIIFLPETQTDLWTVV